jgi:twitching motility protein PilT
MASKSTAEPALMRLLSEMDDFPASDLFLCEGKAPAVRVHGTVEPMDMAATTRAELDALLEQVLRGGQAEAFRAGGDLDTGLSLDDGRRFRLNLSRQQGLIAVVARAVPSGDLDFDTLLLPEPVRDLADCPRGLVLVTGATGSGKSTTLAAMVSHINRTRAAHIITIEDPIEFVHADRKSRVSQREVGSDTGSFAQALRHIVRQSPDVIVIGEMRDAETIAVALSASLTGHLVLASLHTIDTTQTLQRILSYYPDHLRAQVAMDLSLSLRGIVSQRLLPRGDGRSRVLAAELLTCTPAVMKLLREQRVDELLDLMRSTKDPGIHTFNKALLDLYRQGEITYEIGLASASSPEEFALQARGMSTGLDTFVGRDDEEDAAEFDMKSLLGQVLERDASDLHLTEGRPPILRISGTLTPIGKRPLSAGDMRMLLYSILSGRQRSIYELDREIDFALAIDGGRRFRVNAYYQKGRMATALRAIPAEIPSADALGLPPTVLSMGTRAHGLLLVVGPTGAGKSTTMACLVDRINSTRRCRIITVEDPIEYSHTSRKATIDQREVYADTHSFSGALKYILRQDPDVILIGEMRDHETISAALTAAETGHLVVATLHANDALQSIDRIIDVFPPYQQPQARTQLAASLIGIVSQRLLRRKDGKGRVAAFEIMVGNSAIRNLVRNDKMHQASSLMEAGARDGMITMDKALKNLLEIGSVDYEEVRGLLTNPQSLPPPPQA